MHSPTPHRLIAKTSKTAETNPHWTAQEHLLRCDNLGGGVQVGRTKWWNDSPSTSTIENPAKLIITKKIMTVRTTTMTKTTLPPATSNKTRNNHCVIHHVRRRKINDDCHEGQHLIIRRDIITNHPRDHLAGNSIAGCNRKASRNSRTIPNESTHGILQESHLERNEVNTSQKAQNEASGHPGKARRSWKTVSIGTSTVNTTIAIPLRQLTTTSHPHQ
mmetsp:Transcript_22692/g.64257  ORF Transcript_22692/g.64257 Transcript_22692/m.64257 type:complete len:218 (-) Transcript_22692:1139-1792(-)